MLEGMSENEISGSGVAYFLAKEINLENKDLIFLAIVGAIGDMQDDNWRMSGLNKKMVEEAVDAGILKKEDGIRLFGRTNRPIHKALEYSTNPFIPGISGNSSSAIQFLSNLGIEIKKDGNWRTLKDLSEDEIKKLATAIICERIREKEVSPDEIFGEIYSVEIGNDIMDVRELATSLNACGRMEQSSVGILSVLGTQPLENINGIVSGYRRMITKYMKWVKQDGNVMKTDKAYYINAGSNIHENFIGTITSICEKSSVLNGGRVIFGIANTSDGKVKISARAPKETVDNGLNLKEMLGGITENHNGYGGGHAAAAGAFLPVGKENEFINSCENYLNKL